MKVNGIKIAFLATLITASSASALSVNVLERQYFTAEQSDKLNQAIVVLNQVLNSPEFRERVLNFTYQGKKQFVQNNGMTNQQIYDLIMSGAEMYPTQQPANDQADMRLSIYTPPWYKRFSKALAYTNQDDPYLHIYKRYYNSAAVSDISDTIIHEWIHKLGFGHDFNSTSRRPYSVPYAIGYIVEDLVETQLKR